MFGPTSDQSAAEGPARFAEQADFFGHVPNERRVGEYLLPATGTIEHCRICGAQIVWTRTPKTGARNDEYYISLIRMAYHRYAHLP